MAQSVKWVYQFDEVHEAEALMGVDWDQVRGLLGRKGANLGDMARLGVPIPPGFTVTTQACNAYLEAGNTVPDGLWEQVLCRLCDRGHGLGAVTETPYSESVSITIPCLRDSSRSSRRERVRCSGTAPAVASEGDTGSCGRVEGG